MAYQVNRLKIGVIGMSEGNGHPYSWSAIFNGYNSEFMKDCPFPVIPDYLSKQKFPEDGLAHLGTVTNIWTQERKISEHIAAAAKIDRVVNNMEDMIGEVDAVLLARDDAKHHFNMALPFLKAGLPVFIDKPLALSVVEAEKIFANQQYDGQIFTCTSLRFSDELHLTPKEKKMIGPIQFVEAQISKSWEKYAVHLLEPIIAGQPNRGNLRYLKTNNSEQFKKVEIFWDNIYALVSTYGAYQVPLNITYFGENGCLAKTVKDTFSCFRKSLQTFVEGIQSKIIVIPRNETLEIIDIIERGIKNA